MSRSMFCVIVSLVTGCTFNVSSFSRDVTSHAPAVPTTLHADFTHIAHLSGFGVTIEGAAATTDASAVVTIAGLLGGGSDPDAVARGVQIDWPVDATDASARGLTIGYTGPQLETIWTEGVVVSLPSATTLDLVGGSTSVDVSGIRAPIHVVADSGSIHVRDADTFVLATDSGSIDVAGHTGTATCTSGSIALMLDGAIVARATSGSIDGQFGGGGTLDTDSGSIDVVLVGALDRDLTLSATSGSIHLSIPVGSALRVETHTGSGSSHVHVGGVSSGDDFTGTIGAGGFLVRATTDSGSIEIEER